MKDYKERRETAERNRGEIKEKETKKMQKEENEITRGIKQ